MREYLEEMIGGWIADDVRALFQRPKNLEGTGFEYQFNHGDFFNGGVKGPVGEISPEGTIHVEKA